MTKPIKIVVLAKQVPDTRNVGKDAMTAEGTVNRAALAAIFNPEDLHALELALRLKDSNPGTTVQLLTMGPGRAADIIREGLFRGADGGVLLTDRKFAGADTLATSYALSCAIKKLTPDLIVAGRQAIDGDTAQVGPQVAEKLGLPQITYVEKVISFDNDEITVSRRLERGVETVTAKLPVVLTVNSSAPVCRPRNAKCLMKYKHAKTVSELQTQDSDYTEFHQLRTYLNIPEWGATDIDGEEEQFGLKGSPTKVKKIENVVFQVKESKKLSDADADIESLIKELIANHTIG
jgi:electron transfer flavoprotein beta subunit